MSTVASTQTAVTQPLPPSATDPAPMQSLTLESIAERYEGDPSRYLLDGKAKSGEIVLRLIGIERIADTFVLKIAIGNEGETDFYVRNLTVQAGTKTLVSRFFFRILVESQGSREGYIVFERPPSGTKAQIKLMEEGGKGREIRTSIPYPF